MRITEIEDDEDDEFEDDEPEEPDFSHLPSAKDAERFRPLMAQGAQQVYDDWSQDEEGHDEMYGGGGICHNIADKLLDVLYQIPGMKNANTISANDEVHVYCIAQFREGIYQVDIPWRYYERGGGYNWTKLPNVTFEPDMVHIDMIDGRPEDYRNYVEDYEED